MYELKKKLGRNSTTLLNTSLMASSFMFTLDFTAKTKALALEILPAV